MSLYHLDADYLIGLAEPYHEHHAKALANVRQWDIDGHILATCSVAWREFYSGKSKPRPPQEVEYVRAMLHGGIVRYGSKQAEKSAEFFNQIGRLKELGNDCDIAATARLANAQLATFNLDDFKRFVPFGLKIVGFSAFPKPPNEQQVSNTKKRIVA